MQLKLTPIVAGLCLLGLVTVPGFAAQTSDNTNEQQLIEKLSQQTAALQKEVVSLQAQVKTLKTDHTVAHSTNHHKHPVKTVTSEQGIVSETSVTQSSVQPAQVKSLNKHAIYIGGMPIIASPYLGQPTTFEPFDLITFMPSVGLDLSILKERNKTYSVYQQQGIELPSDPIVQVSGALEAQYINQKPYVGNKTSDIDLTRGEFDVAANINTWTTGFLAFSYDNAPPAVGPRATNSHVYIYKGFINIGNLSKTPFYGTVGQYYVPFGNYMSYMISDSLPKMLARTKARALQLGFDQAWGVNELNVSAFTFKGDSKTNLNESKLNQLGMNINYGISEAKWNATLGGSLISNIADSVGMQGNGAGSGFGGFSHTSGSVQPENVLVRRVPAYDLYGVLGVGPYSLMAEYVQAFHDFSSENMTYNGRAADPAALNIEAVYSFPAFDLPSSFAVGYGMTKDALALLLPEQRYIAAFNTTIWKNTLESLELRHEINYSSNATATGQGVAVSNNGLGHTSDTLTFQIGVYF